MRFSCVYADFTTEEFSETFLHPDPTKFLKPPLPLRKCRRQHRSAGCLESNAKV